jgi:ornithine lipid hydroxylase
MKKVMPWLHYPLVMASVFSLFALLQSQGVSLMASTYLPIIMAASLITILEIQFPHNKIWQPRFSEIKIDLMFMAVVQLALPPLVSFTFIYWLIQPISALNLPFSQFWPHTWPIWAQAILMILVVDFLRYWLHRAAHTNQYLWRLHAVHHSVQQLYWLNTARFHPLEKILQMMLDSLPFLIMGVNAQVLALYYLAYASNGFLQHANIQFRFGPLNYLLGTADLHRWHHSQRPEESNANYGNNVIIWDLLFGTWFLPKDRSINTLGLLEADYPKTFFGLLRAPFKR